MNLDNVISKLNSTLTELEESGLPNNEIEKIRYHLLNARKVSDELAAQLAPKILYEKIKNEIDDYRDDNWDDGYKARLSVCISTTNYNLLKQSYISLENNVYLGNKLMQLEYQQDVLLYPVDDLPDHVIAIGVR